MAVGNVYSSSGFVFGSLASIRQQAKEIGDRVKRESDARKAEQERTGLIKNKDGDMVELSSLTEKEIERLNDWHDVMSVSPYEAMIGFMASDPNAEEVERSKALGARYAKIQDKMLAGKKLEAEEKKFLREHYPELAAKADQMEQQAEQLKQRLSGCKTKDEAQKAYMETKANLLSSLDKKDGSVLFLMAAIDEAYAEHTGAPRRNAAPLRSVDMKA